MTRPRYVLRHRHRFICLWPRVDDSGLWRHVTWAWWTWDRLPDGIGSRFVEQADAFRKPQKTPEQRAREAGQ